ncbi:hypothetical protein FDJ25_gp050 [Vibrio phage Aphrodite1]|uniref:Uncharacterized protein n=1 Tax=Vibrio phage Aphrodite1 TaxID=2070057 RepID=A0A2I7QHW1_9CAUD|nr:hypothetical protein FDJ25_gp050 [Vibrio phage Aphrodite1]AUR80984.1 hypothetical protein Aphrodite1_0155 [Vibrio phage Aphrodite1]
MFRQKPEKLSQAKLNFITRPLVKHWILEAHRIVKEPGFVGKIVVGACGYRHQDIIIKVEAIDDKPDHYLMTAMNIPFMNSDWEVEVHKHVSLTTQRIPEINEVLDSVTTFGERELLNLTMSNPSSLAEIGINVYGCNSAIHHLDPKVFNVHYQGIGYPLSIDEPKTYPESEMTYDETILETRTAITEIISAEIARYLPYEVEQALMKNQILFGDDRYRPVVLANVPVHQNAGFSVVLDYNGEHFSLLINLVNGHREKFDLALNHVERNEQLHEISDWIRGMCRTTERQFELITECYDRVRSQPTHYGRLDKNSETGEIDLILDKDLFTRDIRVLLVPGK